MAYANIYCILTLLPLTVRSNYINKTEKVILTERYGDRTNVHEYCAGEMFRPRCTGGRDDVIVITDARYGRMNFGRCLEREADFESMANNPRFVGCSSDVKHIVESQCSGLPECDIRVFEQSFEGIRPCMTGLKMHLEASYNCLRVVAESRHCAIPLSTEPQHIVNGISRSRLGQSDTVGCGTSSQLWSVEAVAGKRIAVSIIDFRDVNFSLSRSPSDCQSVYGFIVDQPARKNVSICGEHHSPGPQQHRTDSTAANTLYISQSNRLGLITANELDTKFIVRLEAVGCSDLTPPSEDSWLKRVDDQITVGCYMSRQSWQLNCVNGVWTGNIGVCEHNSGGINDSKKTGMTQQTGERRESNSPGEFLALAAVASAGVAVCCTIICVGIICLRRQQRSVNKGRYQLPSEVIGQWHVTTTRCETNLQP